MNCPNCGTTLKIIAVDNRASRAIVDGRTFDAALPGHAAPAADFAEVRREVTAQAPTLENQVYIPAAWAIVSAIAVGVLVSVLAAALSWPAWVAAVGVGVAFVVAWFARSADMRDLLRNTIEEIAGVDIDGDGEIGEPAQAEAPIRVELYDERGRLSKLLGADDLRMSNDSLRYFARCLVREDYNLTEARWNHDRRAFPQGRNQFRFARSVLEGRRWIVAESEASNARRLPTVAFKSLCRRLATMEGE